MQTRQYVLGLVGFFSLFAASFPVAYWRVSSTEAFSGTPFKSAGLDTEPTQSAQQQ